MMRVPVPRHQIFLASPMSGFAEEADFIEHRAVVLDVLGVLAENGFDQVYYAGLDVPSKAEFMEQAPALLNDYGALRGARLFLLLYPMRILSSVLIELGMALALGKPCVIFCRRRADLPFLVSSAESVEAPGVLPPVRIFEYAETGSLESEIRASIPQLRFLIDGA